MPASTSPYPASPFAAGGRWLADSSRGFLWGVLLSAVLHGLLWWYFGSVDLLRFQPQTLEDDSSEYFEVGLYVQRAEPKKKAASKTPAGRTTNDLARVANAADNTISRPRSEVPDSPPVPPALPSAGRKTLGPGPALPSFVPGSSRPLTLPRGVKNPLPALPGKSSGNASGTEFFNIADQGQRIVYAVDRSGSMIHNNALLVAKTELVASLNRLTPRHQFLVIFYDEIAHPLLLSGDGEGMLLPATSRNIQKIKQKISGIQSKGGTRHMAALQMALQQKPDVIFFLTDANSTLDAREMNELRRLNTARTRIHCIEFGKGPDLTGGNNFLKRLAAMTGGKYQYRDVQQFQH